MSILSLLRAGVRPSQIWKNHEFTERQVKYVLKKLRDCGLIRKLGYGTWEVLETEDSKGRRYKIVHRVPKEHPPPKGTKPDDVRGHGIVATVKIPKFVNWPDRHIILQVREIPFTPIPQGQRIAVGDVKKVWLTPRSIVYYLPFSWYGDASQDVAERILEDVIKLVQRTERMLGIASLKVGGLYWVKFSRQHYSLIRNGLARLYDKPTRKKLFVRDDAGTWLLIDNSYNLHELEAVHPETAKDDNRVVQEFFNSLKKSPITPQFVLERFAETAQQIKQAHGQLAHYAQNLETHVAAVNTLSSQALENSKTTATLREAVHRLAETIRAFSMPPDLKAKLPEKVLLRTESPSSEPLKERRACGLCGQVAAIPPGRDRCDVCEGLIKDWTRPRRDSRIDEHVIT